MKRIDEDAEAEASDGASAAPTPLAAVAPFQSLAAKNTWKRYVAGGLVGVTLAVGAAAGYHFAVAPKFAEIAAQEALVVAQEARGTLEAKNTDLVAFTTGKIIEGANPDQKALAEGTASAASGVFTFWNGKATDARVMDVYVDFSSQRSRDFLLQNQLSLKGAIEAGSIILQVHPVPNSASPFSMYAPEALAEAFVVQPTSAWEYLMGLLKLSAELSATPVEDVVQAVATRATDMGIAGIDAASITNGTFSSWLLATGQEPEIKSPHGLPGIYFDGKLFDSSTIDINDAPVFRKYLTK